MISAKQINKVISADTLDAEAMMKVAKSGNNDCAIERSEY